MRAVLGRIWRILGLRTRDDVRAMRAELSRLESDLRQVQRRLQEMETRLEDDEPKVRIHAGPPPN